MRLSERVDAQKVDGWWYVCANVSANHCHAGANTVATQDLLTWRTMTRSVAASPAMHMLSACKKKTRKCQVNHACLDIFDRALGKIHDALHDKQNNNQRQSHTFPSSRNLFSSARGMDSKSNISRVFFGGCTE